MKNFIKTAFLCVAVGAIVAPISFAAKNDTDDAAIARNLDTFNSLYKELNTFYVDTIDAQKSIETAINAMLNDIDPYTEYIPAKAQDDFIALTRGEYGGIGSYIMERKGATYFSEPYENSPAAKAGIRPGDKIVMIENDSVIGWKSDKVSERLKGQPNTKVHLVIERPYVDKNLTFDILREKIQLPSVPYYGLQRGNIGYISLTSFTDKSPQEVKDALIALKKNPNVKYIVLDLRGNGGGLLESAVQIVGLFVPKNTEVLQTRGRLKQNNKIYKTTQEPIDTQIPLAVLVDGGSASSSEIVAGSLQDLDRAVIIGSRSYGKGLVQTTRPLPFDGMLKVTIAKYYIPSGRLIQAIDYSHRNPDGSVARIPDSLTHIFKTANGREVRDGGGITPDVDVKYAPLNRMVYNIVKDNWAFDFATKYAHDHQTIPAAKDFVITDSIYAQFKRFIRPSEFQYDKVCEDKLKNLKETADTEGYMNDSVKAQLEILNKLLKHDLNHDLDIQRKQISKILAGEIVNRYYYQKGEAEIGLKDDEGMDAVVKFFSQPDNYSKTLKISQTSSTTTPKKKKK